MQYSAQASQGAAAAVVREEFHDSELVGCALGNVLNRALSKTALLMMEIMIYIKTFERIVAHNLFKI